MEREEVRDRRRWRKQARCKVRGLAAVEPEGEDGQGPVNAGGRWRLEGLSETATG